MSFAWWTRFYADRLALEFHSSTAAESTRLPAIAAYRPAFSKKNQR
jgi:hypothetical protein